MSHERRWRRLCSRRSGIARSLPWLAGVVVCAGCGDIRLIDPLATDVDVSRTVIELGIQERGSGARLSFEGYAYGYEWMHARQLVRYLDLGAVSVAGRSAWRRFVRTGEPEYALRATLESVPAGIAVRIGGSAAVPACTLDVPLPVVVPPADGTLVPREQDLVIWLPTLSGALQATDRVTASAVLIDGDGAVHGMALAVSDRSAMHALVIPAELLLSLPGGPLALSLSVRWNHSERAKASAPPCAPALVTRTSVDVTRSVVLQ